MRPGRLVVALVLLLVLPATVPTAAAAETTGRVEHAGRFPCPQAALPTDDGCPFILGLTHVTTCEGERCSIRLIFSATVWSSILLTKGLRVETWYYFGFLAPVCYATSAASESITCTSDIPRTPPFTVAKGSCTPILLAFWYGQPTPGQLMQALDYVGYNFVSWREEVWFNACNP